MYCYLGFFETIPPQLYAYNEKCLSHLSEVFDTILDDKKIIDRATSVTKHYDVNEARCFYDKVREFVMKPKEIIL